MIALCHSKNKDTAKLYDVNWFVRRFKRIFHEEISSNSISYEAQKLHRSEINTMLIPEKHLKKLPKCMLIQIYIAKDKWETDWLAGIVIDEKTRNILYEFWLKNGEVIAYEFYEK